MIRWFTRALRVVPRALEQAHLEWALREIDPFHQDVPYIVRRLAQLKDTP